MTLTDIVLSDPVLSAALAGVVVLIYVASRYLDWRSYYRIHRAKIAVAPYLSPYWFTVSHKGYRDDAEYIATMDFSVRDVWTRLTDAGAEPHLLNSVKVRQHPEVGKQYSQAHAVWTHEDSDGDDDAEQTEVYLFENPEGSTDIYAHYEGSVLDPEDHLYGPQTDGDPRGVVRDALGL